MSNHLASSPEIERRALEALGDAVVAAGADGRISAWTGAASRLTGYSAGEAVGRPLSWLLQGTDEQVLSELPDLGGAERMDAIVTVRRKRSDAFQAAATVTRGGGGTVSLFKPIGPWLDAGEAAGQAYSDWNQRLGSIVRDLMEMAGQDLAALDSTETLAPLLVAQGLRLIPGTECLLSVVPRERLDHFDILAGAGPWAERLVGRSWPWPGTVAGEAMTQRRPIETVRLMERSGLRDTLSEGAIHTARLLPLLSTRPLPDGRQALGTIGFYRQARAYFTPYERRLMAEFAQLVSLTLQRTELGRATQEGVERLRVGVDLAIDLASSLNQREVIRRLIARAASATHADRAALLLIEDDEYVVEDAVDSGGVGAVGRRHSINAVLSDGLPVLQLAVSRRTPMLAGGYQVAGVEAEYSQALNSLRHTLILPLVLSGQVPAALAVGRRGEPPFGAGDIATLQLLGNVAVLALRNARLYSEAEEANRTRSDFLNMAAHELRTPLTVIHGYLSMLEEGSFGPGPERWKQPLRTLVGKTEELGHLVEDLLLASRLESGPIPADVASLDLREAAREAVERARPRARLLGGRLRARLGPGPLRVSADADHIAKIIDNLVNNALTYSRDGEPPSVTVSVSRAAGEAMVSVQDQGRGVPPAASERIFERFFRVEDAGQERQPGTGLGLYISSELAGRHGGRVVLDWSRPGRGSRFSLCLPLVN